FCNRAFRPCASSEACFTIDACLDVDGDGNRECLRPGVCATNADCPAAGEVCGMIFEAATQCSTRGYCRTMADCAAGHECVDAGGVRLCVPSGGSCQASADCPAGAICGSASLAAPQTCISAPL
ncbi:MAG: hypothetical protein IT378_06060, partial [Sandaracinaceae bacterium]|nr:hypothetical protein [Sandaracinaceae bacterium]